MQNDYKPTLFYFNPNIFPDSEYIIRKNELKRYAQALGLRVIDGDYDHAKWRLEIKGLEMEPERGKRCQVCFNCRLRETARVASEEKIGLFLQLRLLPAAGRISNKLTEPDKRPKTLSRDTILG